MHCFSIPVTRASDLGNAHKFY